MYLNILMFVYIHIYVMDVYKEKEGGKDERVGSVIGRERERESLN